jgi:phosphatidylethanolamine-binding protein
VVMMDLSVEPNNIPTETNTTLIHWILPGLSFLNATTTALTSHSDAIAPYFPPGPPAGQTHTYALFLYDEPPNFTIPADYVPIFKNLTASVENRVGFNLTEFVEQTGLGDPLAADWFLVSNTITSAARSSSGMTTMASSTSGAMASSSSSSGCAMIEIETVLVMALGAAGIWLNI